MKVFLAFQRIINTTDILDEVQLILKGAMNHGSVDV